MMEYFRQWRHIWRMRRIRSWKEEREPDWDLVMDDIPIIVDEAQWFLYERARPKERIKVVDCFSTTHNRGTVPGLLPPIPDGHVDYAVWVEWERGGAGWLRRLFHIVVTATKNLQE